MKLNQENKTCEQRLPRLSVILITMNRQHILKQCLESILRQKFADYEIVIVDNASNDGTGDMVQCLFPEARYVPLSKNLGAPGARNYGARMATGEICVFIDDEREAEELVKSGLSKLIFAVDGMDQKTYSKYRINGNLQKIMKNIRLITETKKRLGSSLPLINMRMLVMAHNEHQTDDFVALGKSMDADIVSFKTLCAYRKGDLNADFPRSGKYLRYDLESLRRSDIKQEQYYCYRPWRRLEIFADGAVTPCEFDFEREYLLGTLDDDMPLTTMWNNEVMKDFRRQFMEDIDKISFCNNCPYKGQVVWDPTVEYHWLTEEAKA
jgi:radical SAM protein with 4Fe4S-binding SPASM domain